MSARSDELANATRRAFLEMGGGLSAMKSDQGRWGDER